MYTWYKVDKVQSNVQYFTDMLSLKKLWVESKMNHLGDEDGENLKGVQ